MISNHYSSSTINPTPILNTKKPIRSTSQYPNILVLRLMPIALVLCLKLSFVFEAVFSLLYFLFEMILESKGRTLMLNVLLVSTSSRWSVHWTYSHGVGRVSTRYVRHDPAMKYHIIHVILKMLMRPVLQNNQVPALCI